MIHSRSIVHWSDRQTKLELTMVIYGTVSLSLVYFYPAEGAAGQGAAVGVRDVPVAGLAGDAPPASLQSPVCIGRPASHLVG